VGAARQEARERAGDDRRRRPGDGDQADGQRPAGLERDDQQRDEQRRVAGDPTGPGELDPPDAGVAEDRPERGQGAR
jgi:hypothetical protein